MADYRPKYPFTALVGQERLKLALILSAINPSLSGVLVRGEKGTAKSTAVHALADLLPEVEVVKDCPFRCSPRQPSRMCSDCYEHWQRGESLPLADYKVGVINLPLGATEDRVAGSIDFERVVRYGVKAFQPGLLAEANQGILYVDEINLLSDHLVDILLDAASTGINTIEREGVSLVHPANFVLIGTMNPEEGELRPQLLDRFGLCVDIRSIRALSERVGVIKRWKEFERDQDGFLTHWFQAQERLKGRIIMAKELLDKVSIEDSLLDLITQISLAHQVMGHRADILMEKASKTIAAFEGRLSLHPADIQRAAELVLPHRARSVPLFPKGSPAEGEPLLTGISEQPQDLLKGLFSPTFARYNPSQEGLSRTVQIDKIAPSSPVRQRRYAEGQLLSGREHPAGEATQEWGGTIFATGQSFRIPPLLFEREHLLHRGSGRRGIFKARDRTGRYVRSTSLRTGSGLALDATIRAAAPKQKDRPKKGVAIAIEGDDLREKVRERRTGNLLLFVVDASSSMGLKLMTETKSAILSLLLNAYQRRDQVALIAFRDKEARLLLPPTRSMELAKRLLDNLPVGGKTPLAAGLVSANELIKKHLRKGHQTSPVLVLISDGEANVGLFSDSQYNGVSSEPLMEEIFQIARKIRAERGLKSLVIDTERRSFLSARWKHKEVQTMAKRISFHLGARYYKLQEFKAQDLVGVIKEHRVFAQ